MRNRIKTRGLVSRNKPDGSYYNSKRAECEAKLNRLEKLLAEGYKLSEVRKPSEKPKPTYVVTKVWDKKVKVTIEVFKKRYEPLGFKIIAEF